MLEGLGPLIALGAGVENVSPYSEVWAVWSREQLAEIVGGAAPGRTGRASTSGGPGPTRGSRRRCGPRASRAVAYDAASELTEWRRGRPG